MKIQAALLLLLLAVSVHSFAQVKINKAEQTEQEKLLFAYFLGGLDHKTRTLIESFYPQVLNDYKNAQWPQVKITNYLSAQ